MQLACLQENLRRGIASIGRCVAGKSTLPVLSHILLATDAGRLKLVATNLEIGMTTWIGAKITSEGAITVPARLLLDIVTSLPNQVIELSVDGSHQALALRCAGSTVTINGIEASEFPTIPSASPGSATVIVSAQLLCDMIDQVAFAVATDDTRPVLAGIAMQIAGERIRLIASDGFRIAQRELTLPQPAISSVNVIIPARALTELARSIKGSLGDVYISATPTAGQVTFQVGDLELVSRLIEGKYPDIQRIIPHQFQTRAVLERQQITQSITLASHIATAASNSVQLHLEPGDEHQTGKLTITTSAAEVGENQTIREGQIVGKTRQVILNVKYLADVLHAIPTAQLAIELQSIQSPVIFKPVGMSDYICVIMPMSLR